MMAPGAGRGLLDQKHYFDQQMGCMAGFLNLFDRHQILARKRLPPPPAAGSTSPSDRSDASSLASSFVKESHRSPAHTSSPSHPLPAFEAKDSARPSPKPREASLLSLDGRARAVSDAKGKLRPREIRPAPPPVSSPGDQSDASEAADDSDRQRRSPSVVARLMGLDALPDAVAGGGEPGHAQLRRSASESRVPRDPSYYRFPSPSLAETTALSGNEFIRMVNLGELRAPDAKKPKSPARAPFLPPLQRKSFFDAQDFFPEPRRRGLLPIEIEKRRLMRGMDEAARDLETLKQILEALHLKGLLHSKPFDHQINRLRDRRSHFSDDSPIVVIEPAPTLLCQPSGDPRPPLPPGSGAGRRNATVEATTPSVRRNNRRADQIPTGSNDRKIRAPSSSPPSSNAAESRKSPQPRRRISVVNPPRSPPNRVGPSLVAGRPLPNRRPKQEVTPKRRVGSPAEYHGSAATTASSLHFERSWAEDHKAGRQLLERCDRLLHSIAAFTAAEKVSVAQEQQPSPVSVLDSPVLGEESSPRSPASKPSFDIKGDQTGECEEDAIASASGDGQTECEEEATASASGDGPDAHEEEVACDDGDHAYVAEILRVSDRHNEATDVYAFLEKRRADTSKPARLHRRMVFDAVTEILDRKRCASSPPWESFVRPGSLSVAARDGDRAAVLLPEVWAELGRAQEHMSFDDVNVVTCWAVSRDLAQENFDGWARPAAEVADAVIQIERQIFKDLIAGTIRDLADSSSAAAVVASGKPRFLSRRKLVY